MRTIVLLVLGCVFAAGILLPSAAGHHCDTRIAIYGRSFLAPVAPPPYTYTNQGICPRTDDAIDHTLPPQTEQIFVRVNGDFGASKPTLRLELDGLGFTANVFTLARTANERGPMTYQLSEWLNVPSPESGASITATVLYPDGAMRSTYRMSVIVTLPEPPVDPTQPPELPPAP